jgi:hypothetical protein
MSKVLEFPSTRSGKHLRKTVEAFGYVAEFYADTQAEPVIHHYVVMRKGSVQILGWGQEGSAETAERNARHTMEMLSRSALTAGRGWKL